MTDAAFIIDASEAALLTGSAVTPVSVKAADSSGKRSFSGVLKERIQGEQTRQSQPNTQTSKKSLESTGTVAGQRDVNGVDEPARGNQLPSTVSNLTATAANSGVAGATETAALAMMSQQFSTSFAGLDISGGTAGVGSTLEEPVTGLSSSLPLTLLGEKAVNVASNGLGKGVLEKSAMTLEEGIAQRISTAVVQTPQLAVADPKLAMAAKLGGLPLDSQSLSKEQNGQVNLQAGHLSLLGQAISGPAQHALNNALQKEAGLGKSVSAMTPVNGQRPQGLSMRQSGLNSLSNGLATSTAVLESSGITASTARADVHLSMHMDTLLNKSLKPISSQPVTASLVDSSSALTGFSRLTASVITAPTPALQLPTQVGQPGWASELGQRVSWLAQNDIREAKLQLNPRSLGPVEVRISYGLDQQLSVNFTASNATAREALDIALPRLREMFEQQGLNLAEAKTSQESFTRQREKNNEQGEPQAQMGKWPGEADNPSRQPVSLNSVPIGEGIIDAYA